jgi:hypothetical protein
MTNIGTFSAEAFAISLQQLNERMRDFNKVILLIEDQDAFSDTCTKALHELGL